MYRKIHAALVLILLAGLAACAPAPGKAIPTASATLLPSPSPTATITPLAWEGERLPGVDQGLSGELFTLPQDVFGLLREKGAAAIELDTGVAGGVSNGLCSVAIAEQLTTGSQLQADGEGPAVYAFDGQKDQLAFWQNLAVPEGVSCVAFVAQDGNKWGLESGTVAVWFFTGGGKAGSNVINADNPLRIMISADNSAKFAFTNNQLTMTTLSASGQIIEEQKVSFLPPLPSELQAWSEAHPDFQWQGVVDNSGFHVDLGAGRLINVPLEQMSDRVKIDQYGLLQVFDEQNIITAEYDPDQKSWVDIQQLAQNLHCQEGATCFNDARNTPIPGGIDVELSSTGIFKTTDALDKDTGEKIGNFLLVQMVTKNEEKAPLTVWVLVQAESSSDPGVNAYKIGVGTIRYRAEGRYPTGKDLVVYPIQEWRQWVPKGSTWTLEFSKSNYVYPFLTFINITAQGCKQAG